MYKRLLPIEPIRFVWHVPINFARYFAACVSSSQTMQVASALAYTTLLSLVPLVAVAFSFLDALPGFGGFEDRVREFVFNNFVPAFGETVAEYLDQFTDKVAQLTLTGVIALVAVALMLMATIENALNRIWRVGEKRRPVMRFLVYWLLLTLGPILVGVSVASTSYFLSLPSVGSLGGFGLTQWLLSLIPFLSTAVALTLLYLLVPNCRVPARNAVIGGVLAAIVFESAKFGFGYYVTIVPTYEIVYGALAVLPIFLVWLYISWVVVLMGAQLAYSLSTFRAGETVAEPERYHWDLIDVCLVLSPLWQLQREGTGLTLEQISALEPDLPVEHINQILADLQAAHWVWQKSGDSGQWILTRDLSEQTLLDLHQALPGKLPDAHTSRIPRNVTERTLQEAFDRYRESVRDALSVPIKPLLLDSERDALPLPITAAEP